MQNQQIAQCLAALNKPHLRYADIQQAISLFSELDGVNMQVVGHSFEKRPIHLFTVGTGEQTIFAWTQMHGDEATATAAVFDLLAELLFSQPDLLNLYTIHIMPMLNPDGAELQTRQTAQGIDMNRDALSLQTPEGRLLMRLAKELKPDVAFNLHDQSPYYQSGTTGNPSTIAFLAPAFDHEKTIDAPRKRAMQLIAAMNGELQQHIPNCVARYDDTHSPRSFGDNIAGLGISTILIESGAAIDDPNRQLARRMNVKAILTALNILNNELNTSIDDYFAIPENVSDGLASLLIHNLHFDGYRADVAIKQTGRYSDQFYVDFVGDKGVLAGLNTLDAANFQYQRGKVFEVTSAFDLTDDRYLELLKEGFIVFHDPNKRLNVVTSYSVLFGNQLFGNQPLGLENALRLNQPAYFLLSNRENPNDIEAAVVNGQVLQLNQI